MTIEREIYTGLTDRSRITCRADKREAVPVALAAE